MRHFLSSTIWRDEMREIETSKAKLPGWFFVSFSRVSLSRMSCSLWPEIAKGNRHSRSCVPLRTNMNRMVELSLFRKKSQQERRKNSVTTKNCSNKEKPDGKWTLGTGRGQHYATVYERQVPVFLRLRLYFVSIQSNCSPELSQFRRIRCVCSISSSSFVSDMIRYVYLVVSCSVESVILSVMSFSLTENRCSAPFRAEHRLLLLLSRTHCERKTDTICDDIP